MPKLPKFLRNSPKESRVIRCNNKGICAYKHALKELAVFAILTAKDINDTIRVIADYRVDICPFNVNIRDCAIIIRRRGGGAEKLELSSKNLDSTPPSKQKKLVLEVFSEKTQHTLKMADANKHTLFQ